MRISKCKTCNAPIIWLKTASGRVMPVDADKVSDAETQFDKERHVSHFSTCPQASQYRRPR